MNPLNKIKQTSTASEANDSVAPRTDWLWAGCFFLCSAVGLALLLSNALGTTASLWLGLALSAVSIAAQTRLSHSFAAALGHTTVLVALTLLLGTPILSAVLGAAISACCAFYVLCTHGGAYAPALPLLAYGISALLLQDPLSAALSLVVLPPSLTLLYCLRRHTARISAICRLSIAILATALSVAGILLHRQFGALSVGALRLFLDEIRALATAAITESIALSGVALGVNGDALHYAETTIGKLFNVLPAILVILTLLIAYGIHSAALRCLIGRKESTESINKMLSFDMSLSSALLFFAAILLTLLPANEKTEFYSAVALNLCLILVPGMLMTAFIALNVLLFAKAPSCFSPLLYFAVLFLSIQFPTIMLPIAAVFGAGVVILGRIKIRPHKNNS